MVLLKFAVIFFHLRLAYVSATPFSETGSPSRRLPQDTLNPASGTPGDPAPGQGGNTLAGNHVASRDDASDTSCIPMRVEDLKQLKGYPKLVDYVTQNFGSGSVRVLTNPQEYPEQTAQFCAHGVVPVLANDSHNCTTHPATGLAGYNMDRNQTLVELGAADQIPIPTNQSLMLTFGLPASCNQQAKTVKADIRNIPAYSSVTVEGDQISRSDLQNKTCHSAAISTTFNASATATVNLTASGYAWFFFDSQTSPQDNKTDLHYKWGFFLPTVLPDPNDRTVTLNITGGLGGTGHTIVCL